MILVFHDLDALGCPHDLGLGTPPLFLVFNWTCWASTRHLESLSKSLSLAKTRRCNARNLPWRSCTSSGYWHIQRISDGWYFAAKQLQKFWMANGNFAWFPVSCIFSSKTTRGSEHQNTDKLQGTRGMSSSSALFSQPKRANPLLISFVRDIETQY